MVNIVSRMRKLREILWIRVGPGALVLPKEVSKIAMEFNTKIDGGHRGARKFWREMLPRIKYRNPSVPIEISRHTDPKGPAKLYIYTSTASSSSQTQPPSNPPQSATYTPQKSEQSQSLSPQNTATPETAKPTHTIDLRMVAESQILAELVRVTQAEIVEATEEERQELAEIAEYKVRAQKDREEVREKLVAERKEAELLRLARGEAGLTTA